MHDENLNARSFARRGTSRGGSDPHTDVLTRFLIVASPRKDRLPTMYGSTVFCHTCQTNQMLRNNLLSNYLPPPNVRSPPRLR